MMLEGMTVYHKQLGVGIITALTEDDSQVFCRFLFYSSEVLLKKTAVKVIIVKPEDQEKIKSIGSRSDVANFI